MSEIEKGCVREMHDLKQRFLLESLDTLIIRVVLILMGLLNKCGFRKCLRYCFNGFITFIMSFLSSQITVYGFVLIKKDSISRLISLFKYIINN